MRRDAWGRQQGRAGNIRKAARNRVFLPFPEFDQEPRPFHIYIYKKEAGQPPRQWDDTIWRWQALPMDINRPVRTKLKGGAGGGLRKWTLWCM